LIKKLGRNLPCIETAEKKQKEEPGKDATHALRGQEGAGEASKKRPCETKRQQGSEKKFMKRFADH